MIKYIIGFIRNIFNPAVSIFTLIDNTSKVNEKAKIHHGVKLYNSMINSYSYIGPGSEIICTDIAKFCSIADNCSIGLPTHSMKNISTSPIFTSKNNGTGHSWTKLNTTEEYQRVTIGHDVWIGTKVIILGGIKIGNGAIIGAGSIVTKDIPDYAIAVGVPTKVIKYRFERSIIEKLTELEWWKMSEEKLIENIHLFQIENFSLEDLKKIKNK